MTNCFLKGTAEVGRVLVGGLTLGLSTVVNGGIKDLSHECIEIIYTCERCSQGNQRFTADVSESGATFRCGYYRYEYRERGSHEPRCMTVEDVEGMYKRVGNEYGFFFENCFTWSSHLWSYLTEY